MKKFLVGAALSVSMLVSSGSVSIAQEATLSPAAAAVLSFCLTATTADLATTCAAQILALGDEADLVLAALTAANPPGVNVASIATQVSGTGAVGSPV